MYLHVRTHPIPTLRSSNLRRGRPGKLKALMERRPPRGPFSRQPIVYLADGAPRLANEIRHMRQACAPKPIAPAIFPPANSIYRKKLPPACPATTDRKSTRLHSSH